MNNDIILDLEGVNTFYGKIHALHDISFEVKSGEIVTLIGSNGAGKSTTLRTISSQLTPVTGRVLYKGNVISRMPAHEVVSLGMPMCRKAGKSFRRLRWRKTFKWAHSG